MPVREWMSLPEAIELIMKRTGKNRRQARRALLDYMADGSCPARAYDLETGDDLGPIPPDVFQREN